MNPTRNVIVHYHTFKNSGTSFDQLLSENFGDQHIEFDGPFPYTIFNQVELINIIRRNQPIQAFSSHSIRLPVPTALECNVLAAVFIRHPILRVRSVYGYSKRTAVAKREQGSDAAQPTEAWAAEESFDDWVTLHRKAKDLHLLSNSQTQMFSGVYLAGGQSAMAKANANDSFRFSDLPQAKRNLAGVPLLARTEYYDEDVSKFPAILAEYGIEFEVVDKEPANVTSPDSGMPVVERVERVFAELSEENANWLRNANRQDMELFHYAGKLIAQRG